MVLVVIIGVITVCVLLTVFIVYVYYKSKLGIDKTLDNLEPSVSTLLTQGLDGSILIITDRKTRNFVQFSKYIESPEEFGVELGFPKVDWSLVFFEKFRRYCDLNDIFYVIDCDTDVTFLNINFKKDTFAAASVALQIFSVIFEISPQDRVAVIIKK